MNKPTNNSNHHITSPLSQVFKLLISVSYEVS